MWIKNKSLLEPLADSKIVNRDYIVAIGTQTVGPEFIEKEKNPFQRNFFMPVFYLWKVHRNHPLKIFSPGLNYSHIYPVNGKNRVPAEVHRDRMAHDLTAFVLHPFAVEPDSSSNWEKFNIEKGFVAENGERRDANLLYLEHGWNIHNQDNLRVSEVMPSQVINHFFHWLYSGKEIHSHNKTFDQRLEGKIEVPIGRSRELTAKICGILEDRYKTRLSFKDYRKEYPKIFNKN